MFMGVQLNSLFDRKYVGTLYKHVLKKCIDFITICLNYILEFRNTKSQFMANLV